MKSTFQFENIDILEHGRMVNEAYLSLITSLINNEETVLSITSEQKEWLLNNQYNHDVMAEYHIYHDCGKPYCKIINDEGKQQFPNHAEVSTMIYNKYFSNELISKLINADMCFHILKSESLELWIEENKSNPKFLASLYLTAWAELLANCTMFGGTETTSFKIKKKALIKAGNKLFKTFNL